MRAVFGRVILLKTSYKIIFLVLFATIFFFVALPLRNPLFENVYSTVLTDNKGAVISAAVSDDGQWRFPPSKEIPQKLEKCIITFEDKNFYYHPGVDPISLLRSLFSNIRNKQVVSGGSTLTMQVVRLARKNKDRKIAEKIIEMIYAVKLNFLYSKKELLLLYITHAPYGGNIVGAETASWRYFNRNMKSLSWAEASLLAVLPNNPSMMYPGKNMDNLRFKRDWLLDKLYRKKIISKEDCELAKFEDLPDRFYSIPQVAPHLLTRAMNEGRKNKYIKTTIDMNVQLLANEIVDRHYSKLKLSKIYNGCTVVIKIDTGETVCYVGNTRDSILKKRGNSVDIITSKRSPGSLLKPFLYMFMMDEGLLMPGQIVPDVPIVFDGFAPKNFSRSYDGAVYANDALVRSLNIPFVYLLKDYGYQKFYHRLEKVGFKFDNESSFYSLSMILGGAETTLWDLTSSYASLARSLSKYSERYGKKRYSNDDFKKNYYIYGQDNHSAGDCSTEGEVSAGAMWFTFMAMKEVVRPGEDVIWDRYESSQKIAWKTGTSYGNKDGWAIGFNREYCVGVWIGNADGEGRPEIKGVNVAAPVMFDIFGVLPRGEWFERPENEISVVNICRKSGMIASRFCDDTSLQEIPSSCANMDCCKYHKTIHLDETEKFQVESSYYPVNKMVNKNYFILPPVMEWFYKKRNGSYVSVPPFKNNIDNEMSFIYPSSNVRILVPVELDGSPGKALFEIAHRRPETIVYWHLDGNYIGQTKGIHQIGLNPSTGGHEISVIDEKGNILTKKFEIVSKMK